MPIKVAAVRGMNDITPPHTAAWQYLEQRLQRLAAQYGYAELRMPLLEKTELFKRSVGDATDIVEKEMYTFADRNDESLTLRPEGTASCVRAGIEHGLLYNQITRLYYCGPMFRYERPQRGRYRQFHHFGVEAFGMATPAIEAELIFMTAQLWRELGLTERVHLQINSLGSTATRATYRTALVDYFTQHSAALDADSTRRLQTNPLRILDSKNPELQMLIAGAPVLLDYLDTESRQHLDTLIASLDAAQIAYQLNPRLVRGLDYYNHTVFEWVMSEAGAQNTVCAGGRYDNLVEQLGGQATPAVGFAIGLERLILLLAEMPPKVRQAPDVYFIMAGAAAQQRGLLIAETLRSALPALRLVCDCTGSHVKNQFKRADKSAAALALVLGEEELEKASIIIKPLRARDAVQTTLSLTELPHFLTNYLAQMPLEFS